VTHRGVNVDDARPDRHAAEQYTTWSQSRSHFLRQLNGRRHVGQIFCGSGPDRRVLTRPA
jgi:hypothetical protein